MLLNFQESEPRRSYKHGSYKKNSVTHFAVSRCFFLLSEATDFFVLGDQPIYSLQRKLSAAKFRMDAHV